MTRWPTAYSCSRPPPSASMIPTGSCPRIRPGFTGYSPRTMCTSVPQIVVAVMRITASPSPALVSAPPRWRCDLSLEHDRFHGFHDGLRCVSRVGESKKDSGVFPRVTSAAAGIPSPTAAQRGCTNCEARGMRSRYRSSGSEVCQWPVIRAKPTTARNTNAMPAASAHGGWLSGDAAGRWSGRALLPPGNRDARQAGGALRRTDRREGVDGQSGRTRLRAFRAVDARVGIAGDARRTRERRQPHQRAVWTEISAPRVLHDQGRGRQHEQARSRSSVPCDGRS